MKSIIDTPVSAFASRETTTELTEEEKKIIGIFDEAKLKQYPSEFFNPEKINDGKLFSSTSLVNIGNELFMVDVSDNPYPGNEAMTLKQKSNIYSKNMKDVSHILIQTANKYNSYITIDQLKNFITTETEIDNYSKLNIEPIDSSVDFTDIVDSRYRKTNKKRREMENELDQYAKYLIRKYSGDIQKMADLTEQIIEEKEEWLTNTDITKYDEVVNLDREKSKELTQRIKQDEPLGTHYQPALELAFRTTVGSKLNSKISIWSYFIAHRLMLQFGDIDCMSTFQRRNEYGDSIRETLSRLPNVTLDNTVYHIEDEETYVQVDGHLIIDGKRLLINVIDPFNRQEWDTIDTTHPYTLKKAAKAHTQSFDSAPYVVHVAPELPEPPVIYDKTLKFLLSI